MADSKKTKNLVKLACPICHRVNYRTKKSKKLILEQTKLSRNKYCKFDRKRTLHEETK
jgi:ribosomal protein L33